MAPPAAAAFCRTAEEQRLSPAEAWTSRKGRPLLGVRPPPFGLSMTEDDNVSERSRVKVVPKFWVPVKPKLKPLDHWDLIVAFDSEKYKKEEEAFYVDGRNKMKEKVKSTLDNQMVEINAIREQERKDKEKERTDMLDMIQENKRLSQAEHDAEEAKKQRMKKENDTMTQALNMRRQKQKEKRDKEQQSMTDWLAAEKKRRDEEERWHAEEMRRRLEEEQRRRAEEERRQIEEDGG